MIDNHRAEQEQLATSSAGRLLALISSSAHDLASPGQIADDDPKGGKAKAGLEDISTHDVAVAEARDRLGDRRLFGVTS
jgi:hypothetical protein